MESLFDCLNRVLRELLVLNNKVMQVISKVVSTGRASMSIKNTEKTDLRPLNVKVSLVLRFENV